MIHYRTIRLEFACRKRYCAMERKEIWLFNKNLVLLRGSEASDIKFPKMKRPNRKSTKPEAVAIITFIKNMYYTWFRYVIRFFPLFYSISCVRASILIPKIRAIFWSRPKGAHRILYHTEKNHSEVPTEAPHRTWKIKFYRSEMNIETEWECECECDSTPTWIPHSVHY